MKLDKDVGDLPEDTTFTIRPRSPLGLKLLEMDRGTSAARWRTATCSRPRPRGPGAGGRLQPHLRRAHPPRGAAEPPGLRRRAGRSRRRPERRDRRPPAGLLPARQRGRQPAHPRTDSAASSARWATPRGWCRRWQGSSRRSSAAPPTFEALSREPESLKADDRPLAPGAPGRHRVVAGAAAVPHRQRAARARDAAGGARPAPGAARAELARSSGVPVVGARPRSTRTCGRRSMALRDLAEEPSTGIALRGLTATATTLKPQLRYLGPYQTVCNYWNYFWTYLGEHVSQEGRSASPSARRSRARASSRTTRARWARRGRRTARATRRPRARAARRCTCTASSTRPRSTSEGNADCENGQRGYMRRLSRFADADLEVVTDPHLPGRRGPPTPGARRSPRARPSRASPRPGPVHE